jgi:4-amino-4-deoxy-L-arabinose transferase-like glycosyltransferase
MLPLFLFPWSFWPSLWRETYAVLRRQTADVGVRLTLAWFGVALLAFSAISGKQPHYLLPEVPALALLLGFTLSQADSMGRPILPAIALIVVGGLLELLPLMAANSPQLRWAATVPPWAGLCLFALALVLLPKDNAAATVRRLAWASLLASVWMLVAVVRPISPAFDVRPLAREIGRYQAQNRPVAHERKYHGQYHFPGRLRQPLVVLGQQAIPDWLETHPHGVAVIYVPADTDLQRFRPLFAQPFRNSMALVVDRRATPALRQDHPDRP